MDAIAFLEAQDYTIGREVLLRGVAAVFAIAFVSTLNQFPALLGERGLLPAGEYLRRLRGSGMPTLFLWRRTPYSDRLLRGVCVLGVLLAASVVLGLPQAGPVWIPTAVFLAMWGLYLSVVNIGRRFYGFGWETLLLETGFVVAFLGSHAEAPPALILLFVRWLLFRVEFGAGMIKMRGDRAWRDLTAMDHHHQTQPLPGPLSRWAHLRPRWWHHSETLVSNVVQLAAPWLLFLPQPLSSLGAALIIVTQLALVVTGNYAWLNWLTILLAAAVISDPMWQWMVGGPWPGWEWQGQAGVATSAWWWLVLTTAAFLFLVALSRRSLLNLFSSRQLMNASFNRFHLVNAYGAFGSMTRQRREVIIEGTMSRDAYPDEGSWREYDFRAKPGDPTRRAPQVAPYHLRLDWAMWFLALGAWDEAWFPRLLRSLLAADPAVLRLLRGDPFDGQAPTAVRARVFEYRYASRQERRRTGMWWVREDLGELMPPLRRRD